MSSVIDWALLFAFISISGVVSYNAYNFKRESKYFKNKYINKGYRKGWKQAQKELGEKRND